MPLPVVLPVLLGALAPAHATSLTLKTEETLEDGVTLRKYRASSPSTNVWVLEIDLCANGVYMDATRASDSTQSTGSWAADEDLTAATNGDFYKTDPLRVYGDAVGGGVRWPTDQTGLDSAYSSEWYYEHAGWVAFKHDGIEFSHTGYVKDHSSGLTSGWANTELRPDPPEGTLELVSGFPELVIEGNVVTCSDPEASSCFPDRSDMRDRNPRTAMGFTEDRSTFFLVVADGRTSDDAGLYGSELADIMGQIGAWEAFNLDGGGSSQLYTDAEGGYVNDNSGNNYGSGTRSVANHWGVYAGGRDWLPTRPGHCSTAPTCGVVPAEGATLDDDSECFRTVGPREYWRDASDGYGGHLYWTNAYKSDSPDNWAWWQLDMADAGTYKVETYVEPSYSKFDNVEYAILADGTETRVRVDPNGLDGWLSLGTYTFAAGADQHVALYDNQSSSPGSDQHIAADALRLTRVGSWCGDGVCDAGENCGCADCPVTGEVPDNGLDDDCDGTVDETGGDTGPRDSSSDSESGSDDSSGAPDSDMPEAPGDAVEKDGAGGCGCATGGAPVGALGALLGAAAMLRRRRRA